MVLAGIAPGASFIENFKFNNNTREVIYKCSVLFLTFITFGSYHMARKPLSVVKSSQEFLNCSASGCTSWVTELSGLSGDVAKSYLGLLDTAFLVSLAVFLYASGPVAERVDLRLFLSVGMLGAGIFPIMFGLAYSTEIHSVWYFGAIQILSGMFQATGWPGVLSVLANWFGKGKRGLIMGAWFSHTFIGNILGAVVAGVFADNNWGLSFIIPGVIIVIVGILVFLFLVPDPSQVNLSPLLYVRQYTWDSGSPSSASSSTSITQFPTRPTVPVLTKVTANSNSCSDLLLSDSEHEPLLFSSDRGMVGFWGALKIPGVVEYSLCLFCTKLVVYTFMFWLPNYITDISGLNAFSAANLSTVFDAGGIVGAVLAGALSDLSRMSATTCVLFMMSSIPSMICYLFLQTTWHPLDQIAGVPLFNTSYALHVSLLFLVGLLVNAPFSLIMTSVSTDLGSSQAGSTAMVSAIIDGTASIGAAVGPAMAGVLAREGEWGEVFTMMAIVMGLACIVLARLVYREVRQRLEGK